MLHSSSEVAPGFTDPLQSLCSGGISLPTGTKPERTRDTPPKNNDKGIVGVVYKTCYWDFGIEEMVGK